MDAAALATKLGIGIATGLSTMLVISVLSIPVCWIGNRFIYHSRSMRLIMMLCGLAASPFIFIFLVLYGWYTYLFSDTELTYSWYFGLFPLCTALFESSPGWFGSILPYLGNLIRKPLYGNIETRDDKGEKYYDKQIHLIYPAPPKNASTIKYADNTISYKEAAGSAATVTIKGGVVTQGYVSEELFEAARYAASIAPIRKNDPKEETIPAPPVEWKKVMADLSQKAKFMYGVPGSSAVPSAPAPAPAPAPPPT